MPKFSSGVVKRAVVVAVTAAGMGAGLAVAAPGVASAAPCGFYDDIGRHWYNHCGGGTVPASTSIGTTSSAPTGTRPGVTEIGVPSSFQRIDGAWYIGGC
ncbi:MAG: DUF6355 family natural product biosynthesis protein [Pseudonocardiaceae bacterium]